MHTGNNGVPSEGSYADEYQKMSVYATPSEKATIREAAGAVDQSMSRFMVEAALEKADAADRKDVD